MKTSSFFFDLPEDLIAQYPAEKRGESRLLLMDRKNGDSLTDYMVSDFPKLIPEGSLVVFNNSRVRKARLYAESETGARIEFLLLRNLDEGEGIKWLAMVSKSKKQKPGRKYKFDDGLEAVITEIDGSNRVIEFSHPVNDNWLDTNGHIPLPPYIKRDDAAADAERYQTVFSQKTGSVAAPTAGLHFTDDILSAIKKRGIETVSLTLHVGLGTFLPVRTEDITEHKMHSEDYEISEETAAVINRAVADKRPVTAVGTTSVRTLESEAKRWNSAEVRPGCRSTDIFIYPGYDFRLVTHMFTNFHTPESSLLMLVSAFAGKDSIMKTYSEAVRRKYRFFSYGDAMYIR